MNSALPQQLAIRLQQPLPGPRTYAALAPDLSYGRQAGPAPFNARRAAVLLLLYPHEGRWCLPLTLRPADMLHHAGQISLPGGAIERGESSQAAARRELAEELGYTGQMEILGRLSEFFVYITNFVVTPWIACIAERPAWTPNPREVQEVIELPLEHLLDPQNRDAFLIFRHTYALNAPCYRWQEHRIWGATSMMLCEFSALLGEMEL